MKVLLIDSHHLVGKSLELTLNNYPEVSDFLFLSKPEQALEIIHSYRPTIVLMDIHMGKYNGLELGKEILDRYAVKLVFLSAFNLIEYQKKAYELGAYGFFDQNITLDDLVRLLKMIETKNKKIFEHLKSNIAFPYLTIREKEILQMLSKGAKQIAIAADLQISVRTVRNHIYSINEKLQTNTVLESIIKAIEMGIVNINLQF